MAQASHIIKPPVLEKPPLLPEPDWSLLDSLSDENGYQSQMQLWERIVQLTESLKHAWQHITACNLIIEGAQAQLVVQGMALAKMKASVEAKENKKASDHTHLFPGGKGLVLTDSEFVKKLEERKRVKDDKEEGKHQQKVARVERRVEKEDLEVKWKKMKEDHELAMEKWKTECAWLTNEGMQKKQLPKKPIRPLKPKLAPIVTSSSVRMDDLEVEDSDEDSDEEDGWWLGSSGSTAYNAL
jgi:hypothetical protein